MGLVQDSIDRGTAVEETGPNASRNALQSVTLLETIETENLDAALGGGRVMKKKPGPKKDFFLIVMHSVNGTPKTKDQNYGTSSMAESTWRTFSHISS